MVHALLAGRAMCGFTTLVPKLWMEGVKWVYPTELESITCPKCRKLVIERNQRIKQ